MKAVLSVILFSVASVFASAQSTSDKRNDLEKSSLKGTVASLKETKYSVRFEKGKAVKDTVTESPKSYRYNKSGYITEEVYYELNDSINEKWSFVFDVNNKQLEGNRYMSDGYLVWNYTCTYDAAGNCTEISKNEDGSLVEISRFKYDSKGNCTSISSESEGVWSDTSRYDANNNEIEHFTINPEGEKVMHRTHKYDSNNNMIESVEYDNLGVVSFKQTFAYDKNNRETESKFYSSAGDVMERVGRTYDNKGNAITYTYFKDNGDQKWSITYTYNYDKRQNWTEKTDITDGKATYITERLITYY